MEQLRQVLLPMNAPATPANQLERRLICGSDHLTVLDASENTARPPNKYCVQAPLPLRITPRRVAQKAEPI